MLTVVLLLTIVAAGCEKWVDQKAEEDPRINERAYCNDPEAVNFNWNFPGKPDSSTCFYPSDIFKGTYLFVDSVYNGDNIFDSARSTTTYTLTLMPYSHNHFGLIGFCGNEPLKFTAERSTYRANADSTIQISDTTFDYGQYFCRTQDTIAGFIFKDRNDSSSRLFIEFSVRSDTGLNFHRGTAIKQ